MAKYQKLPVDAGFSCPNRDGTKGVGGCSFCNPRAFAPAYCRELPTITQQIEEGKRFFAQKHRNQQVHYLVYFQSYSGTYAPIDVLRSRYAEALAVDGVVGLVIGTRPDCVDDAVLDLLSQFVTQGYLVIVELGIESCYDKTLRRINRGHDFACAADAIRRTAARGITVGVHLILGLPGETREELLQEADILSSLPIHQLKLHQLQIMQGTRMAEEWLAHPEQFSLFTPEEYADLVAAFVRRLRPDIALDRFAAEAPSSMLLAPRWGLKPQVVQRMVEERLSLCSFKRQCSDKKHIN